MFVGCPWISFNCRDATFSTLISFYCRDAEFSTLISFYCRDETFSTLISFFSAVMQHFLPWYIFYCRDATFSTLISGLSGAGADNITYKLLVDFDLRVYTALPSNVWQGLKFKTTLPCLEAYRTVSLNEGNLDLTMAKILVRIPLRWFHIWIPDSLLAPFVPCDSVERPWERGMNWKSAKKYNQCIPWKKLKNNRHI